MGRAMIAGVLKEEKDFLFVIVSEILYSEDIST